MEPGTIWVIITVIASVASAVAFVFSAVRKERAALREQRATELAGLADVRGQRIKDLESHILRLETRIAKLEGQYDALQNLKIDQIANAVVAKLVGEDFEIS